MRLLTDRLVLTDVTEDDLPGLLAVAHSNPDFLALSEGPDAERAYGLDALGRDLAVAALDPARHPLVLRRRADRAVVDDGDPAHREVVGRAEVLDQHPVDEVPWSWSAPRPPDHPWRGDQMTPAHGSRGSLHLIVRVNGAARRSGAGSWPHGARRRPVI